MRISLITVCYNAASTLEDAVKSVCSQSIPEGASFELEYIVVDGGSTDQTMDVLAPYRKDVTTLISEPDKGLYDAMNKGLAAATGEVVGILNADDFYADAEVLADVAQAFLNPDVDAVYGD
ncbi:glycosyltransferase, partial [Flavobacteriales bacterium]|nr:glycosyltransferase [Flavobacteriales bacterium]